MYNAEKEGSTDVGNYGTGRARMPTPQPGRLFYCGAGILPAQRITEVAGPLPVTGDVFQKEVTFQGRFKMMGKVSI